MTTEPKITPFTTIKAISEQRPLTYADITEQNLPYDTFLINRALSLTSDTVLAASMMNERPWLERDQHATFLIHAIRPRKRFEKWPKNIVDEKIDIIAKYHGMSYREAQLHASLNITEEQLTVMRQVLKDGATPSRFR